MLRAVESYKYLASAVGPRRARELSRAELVARIAAKMGGPGWTAVHAPHLDAITHAMPTVNEAADVLRWAGVPDERIESHLGEFETVSNDLTKAYTDAALEFPTEFAVEKGTSAILYALVRDRRPERVVETGIANGHSSFVILSALKANGTGTLASIDVLPNVGGLVPAVLAQGWVKVIIEDQRPNLDILTRRLAGHLPVDLFFHDGDHRFLGQMLDFKLALNSLTPDGLLMSDDINTTAAWIDANDLGMLGEDPIILLDHRKAVGFAKPNNRRCNQPG
jgi:predicted O-methyltransferase YrrM